jgi:hypothetical protein
MTFCVDIDFQQKCTCLTDRGKAVSIGLAGRCFSLDIRK